MKKSWKLGIIWLATLGMDVIGWIFILLLTLIAGKDLHWNYGLWGVFKRESWGYRVLNWFFKTFAKGSLGGFTLCHGGMLSDGYTKETMEHEQVHVEQLEAACMFAIIVAVVMIQYNPILASCTWVVGGWVIYACATLTAYLRGENMYYGNHLEESAYAQED